MAGASDLLRCGSVGGRRGAGGEQPQCSTQRARWVVGITGVVVFVVGLTSVSVPAAPAQAIDPARDSIPSTSTSLPEFTSTTEKGGGKDKLTGTTTLDSTTTTVVSTSSSQQVDALTSTTSAQRARTSSSTTVDRRRSAGASAGQVTTTTSRSPAMLTTTSIERFADGSLTTTSSPAVLSVEQAANTSGLSPGKLVAVIVGGLLAVAAALTLLTVRYWRATRPGGGLPAG